MRICGLGGVGQRASMLKLLAGHQEPFQKGHSAEDTKMNHCLSSMPATKERQLNWSACKSLLAGQKAQIPTPHTLGCVSSCPPISPKYSNVETTKHPLRMKVDFHPCLVLLHETLHLNPLQGPPQPLCDAPQ